MTHEEALRLAAALVEQELKQTETRCSTLAQFIADCDRARSHSAAWSDGLRELHALHDRRRGLISRRTLIQQALECPVGEGPEMAPMPPSPPSPARTVLRTRRQVQIQRHRRRS